MASVYQHLSSSLLRHARIAQMVMRSFGAASGSSSGSSTKTSEKASPKSDNFEEYKVQEYFEYNPNSYYDLEDTLVKYRLEQPIPGIKY